MNNIIECEFCSHNGDLIKFKNITFNLFVVLQQNVELVGAMITIFQVCTWSYMLRIEAKPWVPKPTKKKD